MKELTSRKNPYIRHLRKLQSDRSYRTEYGEFICDGLKMLEEAVNAGAEITSVLWKTPRTEASEEYLYASADVLGRQYEAPGELFEYVSPLKNSPGPVFTVKMQAKPSRRVSNAVLLENVQDPGNVGTVIRTAAAFGIDAVLLKGDCADVFNPKTVRSTMGAVFRQYVCVTDDPAGFAEENGLRILGAALTDRAVDMRNENLSNSMVCIGNEGRGLSMEMLSECDREIIIPMKPDAESLNAAVAASVIMWEMVR